MTTKIRNPFLLAVLGLALSHCLWAADVDSLIRKGVRLHDEGDFEGAIAAFEKAIAREPDNALARYELSNTYFAKGDYKACVDTAEAGVELDENLAPNLFAIAASCYSEAGNPEKALELFRAGLAKSPDDTMLNFNIGVTLSAQGAIDEAIDHFERAIQSSPAYPSPYLFIGALDRDADGPVPALFYLARFVTLEPDTARTAQASTGVFDMLFAGTTVKSDNEIELTVAISGGDGPFDPLEVGRSIASAKAHLPPEDQEDGEAQDAQTEADRQVGALVTFLQISLELGDEAEARKTTAWGQAIAPILSIHEAGSSEALGYFMAARAGIQGGEEWIEKHPKDLETLGEVLNRSRP